jgi:hypothetical protein
MHLDQHEVLPEVTHIHHPQVIPAAVVADEPGIETVHFRSGDNLTGR